jgi:hypothetical protein
VPWPDWSLRTAAFGGSLGGDTLSMSSRSSASWLERPGRTAAWLLNVAGENADGAVYGTVMIGVLLASEDARHEGYGATIGAAALVLAIYWLTHLYTRTLGQRLQKRESLNMKVLWHSCVHELPIIEGAFVPVLALLVAWAAGSTVATGVNIALWTVVASIVILEIAAGWRARLQPQRLWLQAGVGAVMGSAIIVLKLVLH